MTRAALVRTLSSGKLQWIIHPDFFSPGALKIAQDMPENLWEKLT